MWFFCRLSLALGSLEKVNTDLQQEVFETCTRIEINIFKKCGIDNLSLIPKDLNLAEFDACSKRIFSQVFRLKPSDPKCFGVYEGLCKKPGQERFNCNANGVRNSLYFFQLINWVSEFPAENLLILPSEKLYDYTPQTLQTIEKFLGIYNEVNPFSWEIITGKAYNIGSPRYSTQPGNLHVAFEEADVLKDKYPPMSPEFRMYLQAFFLPFNEALADLLGKPNFWLYSDVL